MVPGGKKGTEEQHMGHASQVLCMAISSDGKYLVWGQGWRDGHGVCSAWVLGVQAHAQMCPAGLKQPLSSTGSRMGPWDSQSPQSGSGGRGGL